MKSNAEQRAQFIGCMEGKMSLSDMEELTAPLPDDVIDLFYSMQGLEEFDKNSSLVMAI